MPGRAEGGNVERARFKLGSPNAEDCGDEGGTAPPFGDISPTRGEITRSSNLFTGSSTSASYAPASA
jgi:hypothetical protein